jgi:2-polyprenyl-3-methyl-5-hydroxy-6-metoxy-1,4-benzoquinol methylase
MPDKTTPTHRYFRGDRGDLLGWLDIGGRRVLEIGCGEGGNASWLREHGATRIVGIEPHPASAALAARVYDLVLTERVETGLGRLDETFDLIICADVLEHLIDPWAAVAELADKADPDATLLISIPNIRFVRAAWAIVFGAGFEYTAEGIFDRTHLRFFTRRNVGTMLRDGRWRPIRWGYGRSSRYRRLKDVLWRLTRGLSGEFLAYQWFVAATPEPSAVGHGTKSGDHRSDQR